MTDTATRAADGGPRRRTRVAAARETLRASLSPPDRSERVPLADADGRVLATPVTASVDVPDTDRAATDGYAVRARETFDAGARSPAVFEVGDRAAPGTATSVDAGDPLPEGADAVVPVADADRRAGAVEVGAVPEGANVAWTGAELAAGDRVLSAGRRLEPPRLAAVAAGGVDEVAVAPIPRVVVLPVGTDGTDTDGPLIARLVERWGGDATRADPLDADRQAVADALAETDADLAVTTGATGAGGGDCVPDAIDAVGDLAFHGLALAPGETTAAGTVDGVPVLALPGAPAACLVAAAHLLRPAVHRAAGLAHAADVATTSLRATLDAKVESRVGYRTATPVALAPEDDAWTATPETADRQGAARADGWVVLPESAEGVPSESDVTVERWGVEGVGR